MRKKIIFLIIISVILSGFVNHRELNKLSIVSAVGIDITEDGRYTATAQIINSKNMAETNSGGSSDQPKIITYSTTGGSIQEALRNTISESPQRLYLAHMELLLLSEEAAKKDLTDILDFFLRDNEASNDFIIAVAKGYKANDILETLTPLEDNPTMNVKDSIETTQIYKGSTTDRALTKDLQILLSNKESIVLPAVTLQGEVAEGKTMENLKEAETKAKVLIESMAYFDKNRNLKGYLQPEDSIAYNIMHDELKHSILQLGEGEYKTVIDIISSKTKLVPKYEDGKFIVEAKIDVNANVTEVGRFVSVNTTDAIADTADRVIDELQSRLEKYIYNCQNIYQSDILGYEKLFYKKLNKEYKVMANEFDSKYFKEVETKFDISVKFMNEGGVIKKW